MYLGEIVEHDKTDRIFTAPSNKLIEEYILPEGSIGDNMGKLYLKRTDRFGKGTVLKTRFNGRMRNKRLDKIYLLKGILSSQRML